MPARPARAADGDYEIYPGHPVGPNRISLGFDALAKAISGQPAITLDGFGGVSWSEVRNGLSAALERAGVHARWVDVADAIRPTVEIEAMVAPFLGDGDPLFGTAFTGELADFFDPDRLAQLRPDASAMATIVYGCGAALAGWDGPLVYVDVPKNEIQFRARAGAVHNLGADPGHTHREIYKRCYFVDWPALSAHKARLLPRIDVVVDAQRSDEPAVMSGDDLRAALGSLSSSVFRVRPWFEPGPWGGQWIKEHIPQLPQDPPNYAWSFELIVPENGLLFESDGALLEVSFDFLMFHDAAGVLGESATRFGAEFPIRFDFLDTFDGGNLSVQVHPRPDYIRTHFGERFTQDETYYILDCGPDSEVYLGFQDDIDPVEFRRELERSLADGSEVDIASFVQRLPAAKHDLFLIPHGTVHCSGRDNLVLEISATPYIFTFKLYDWLRLDLEGRRRPLNIERAFENVFFDRKGKRIRDEFVSVPRQVDAGAGWALLHVPTHADHFYDVQRLELEGEVDLPTRGSVQVMSLVEGESIIVEAGGTTRTFHYAETFVVPAAAESFRLRTDRGPAKVVLAFVKEGRGPT